MNLLTFRGVTKRKKLSFALGGLTWQSTSKLLLLLPEVKADSGDEETTMDDFILKVIDDFNRITGLSRETLIEEPFSLLHPWFDQDEGFLNSFPRSWERSQLFSFINKSVSFRFTSAYVSSEKTQPFHSQLSTNRPKLFSFRNGDFSRNRRRTEGFDVKGSSKHRSLTSTSGYVSWNCELKHFQGIFN